ncbi:uncharacterized protein LOC144823878 [Lissotriton helveticus]
MGSGRGVPLPAWIFIVAATCFQQYAHAQTEEGVLQADDPEEVSYYGQQNEEVVSSGGIPRGALRQIPKPLIEAHNDQICSTWGNSHFKTFDGDVFHFPGTCNYVLVSNCKSTYESFNIQIRREVVNNIPTITRITLVLEGVVIQLKNGSVKVNDEETELPYSHAGIQMDLNGIYLRVSYKEGMDFTWNEEDAIMVELSENYANTTCGLCGNFNDIPKDEFLVNGFEMTPQQYGNFHKLNDPTEECEDMIVEPLNNCTGYEVEYCESILTSSAFADCNPAIHVQPYIEACAQDLCRCNNETQSFCLCNTFTEYSRQCTHSGSKPKNWRKPDLCPITCPFNMDYEECSLPCVDTCSNNEQSALCDDHCSNGCFCPPGYVYDDITSSGCMKQEDCPCNFNGKTYALGSNYTTACQRCTCGGGTWACEKLPCVGTCSVDGGSHISTFDETLYNFHGDCGYVLAKDCVGNSFSVMAEMRMCGRTESETCMKSVSISLNGGEKTFFIRPDCTVLMNMVHAELPIVSDGVTVFKPSSSYMIMETNFGLQVEIEVKHFLQVRIRLQPHFEGKTCGLCGNFNKDQADDFKTLSGVVEGTGASFGNNWKTQSDCPNVKNIHEDPCASSVQNAEYAEHHCQMLSDPLGPFEPCHAFLAPAPFERNCMFDTCNCEKTEDCMCAAISSYVRACAAKGIFLEGWRSEICGKYSEDCPATQTYTYSAHKCQATCRSLSEPDNSCGVTILPVDGCVCPEGMYLDESSKCVEVEECGCYYQGSSMAPGEVVHDNKAICTCSQGKVSCLGVTVKDPECDAPMVYFDCANVSSNAQGSECQKSCQTYDVECFSTHCVKGCICPEGMVLDGKGGCIQAEACPCLHNEAEYQPGEEISVSCNTCTCKNRKWQCTDKPCFGTCTVYGEGHYITFDSKRYSFSGDCQYTLAQDYCGNSTAGTFRVIIENMPCGTTGTTCSKAIRVFMGGNELILHEEHIDVVQRDSTVDMPFNVRSTGIYMVIESKHGMALMWDKKTSMFLKLSSKFKGTVCGLCGNFDSNGINDFTTRSQSVVGDVLEFGNSWKANPTCPDALESKDACTANPYRKAWSQKQCSIIKSDAFSTCHSQVDPSKYYEACVTDSCACDTGGDCECFCTAVAAYAQACSEVGVCIHWRTPNICPLFCDFYNPDGDCEWHYKPCGAPCMKTCVNPGGKCLYELPGLEGCYPSCPEDRPYFDEQNMACTANCGCYDNHGNLYRPGSKIPSVENCMSCSCIGNDMKCNYDLTACFCSYGGKKYKYGDEIYRTGDNLGGCFVATCAANGTINRHITECSTTAPTTAFTFTTDTPTSSHTSAPPTPTVCVHEVCSWTGWLDHSYPGPRPEDGDYETLELMEEKGEKVCKTPKEVRCRAADFPDSTLEEVGQVVQCTPQTGLTCNNYDQKPVRKCNNFQASFLCCSYVPCGSTPSSTTTSATEPTTTTGTTGAPSTPTGTETTTSAGTTGTLPTTEKQPTTTTGVTGRPSTPGTEPTTTTGTTGSPSTPGTEPTTTTGMTGTSSTPGTEPTTTAGTTETPSSPGTEHTTITGTTGTPSTPGTEHTTPTGTTGTLSTPGTEPTTTTGTTGSPTPGTEPTTTTGTTGTPLIPSTESTTTTGTTGTSSTPGTEPTTSTGTTETPSTPGTEHTTTTGKTETSTTSVTEPTTTTGTTGAPSTPGTEPTTTTGTTGTPSTPGTESTTTIGTTVAPSTSGTEPTTSTGTTGTPSTPGTESTTTIGTTGAPSTPGPEPTTTTGSTGTPSTPGTEPTTTTGTTGTPSTPGTEESTGTTGTQSTPGTETTTGSTETPSTPGTEPTTATGTTGTPSTPGTEATTSTGTTGTQSTPGTVTTTGNTETPSTPGTEPTTTTGTTGTPSTPGTEATTSTGTTGTQSTPGTETTTGTTETPSTPGTEPTTTTGTTRTPSTPVTEATTSTGTTGTQSTPGTETTTGTTETPSTPGTEPTTTTGTTGTPSTPGTEATTSTGTTGTQSTPGTETTTGTTETPSTPGTEPTTTTGTTGTPSTPGTEATTSTSTTGTQSTPGTETTTGTTETSSTPGTEPTTTTGTTGTPSTPGTEATTSTGTTGTQSTPGTETTTGTTETSSTPGTEPTTTTGTTGPPSTPGTEATTSTGTTGTQSTPGTETTTGTTETPSTPGTEPTTTTGTTGTPSTPGTEATTSTGTTGTQSTPGTETTTGTTETPSTPGTEPTTTTGTTGTLSTPGTEATTSTGTTGTQSTPGTETTTGTTETSSTPGTEPTTTTGTTGTPSTPGTEATTSTGTTGTQSTPGTETTTGTTETSSTPGTEPTTTTGTTGTPSTPGTEATTSTGTSGTQSTPGTETTTGTSETPSTPGTEPTTTTGTTGTPSTPGTEATTSTGTTGTQSTPGTETTTGTTETPSTPGTEPTTTTGTTGTPSTTGTDATSSTGTTGTQSTPGTETTTGTTETPSTPGTEPTTTTGTTRTPSTPGTEATTSTGTTGTQSTPGTETTTGTTETPSTPGTEPTTTTGTTGTPSTPGTEATTSTGTTGTQSTPGTETTTGTTETPSTPGTEPTTTTGTTGTPSTPGTEATTSTGTMGTPSTPGSETATTTGTIGTPSTPGTEPTTTTGTPGTPSTSGTEPTTPTGTTGTQSTPGTETTTGTTKTQSTPGTETSMTTGSTGTESTPGTEPPTTSGTTGTPLTPTTKPTTTTGSTGSSSTPGTEPSTTMGTTSTTTSVTPTCHCKVGENLIPPGGVIYNTTDKEGCFYFAICGADCTPVRSKGPCITTGTPPPQVTSPITTVTPVTPEGTTETTTPNTTERPPVTTTPSSSGSLPTTHKRPDFNFTDGCESVEPYREIGETWEINKCTNATCEFGGNITLQHVECPPVKEITCDSGLAPKQVYDEKGCCFQYECESCVGPDGKPRMPGESWTSNCQKCSCNIDTISVQCEEIKCQESTPPACDKEGFELVEAPVPENPCCTEMTCKCIPTLCNPDVKKCEIGFTLSSILSAGDCCAKMECVPEKVCVFNNVTYQPGSNIPQVKGACKECECTDQVDPDTQLLTVTCQDTVCQKDCSEGFEYTETPEECCGKCVQTKCVMKTQNNETKVLEVGEIWNPSGDDCGMQYECEKFNEHFVVSSVKRVCPALEPADCPNEYRQKTSDGCCEICKLPQSSCTPQPKATVLSHGTCNTTVELSVCDGLCSSTSGFSSMTRAMEHKCSCCQELKKSNKTAELVCEDGTSISFSYVTVDECGCVGTVCIPEEGTWAAQPENSRRRRR